MQLFLAIIKYFVILPPAVIAIFLSVNGKHITAFQQLTEKGFAEDIASCHVVDGRIKKNTKEDRVNKRSWMVCCNNDRCVTFHSFPVMKVNLPEKQPVDNMNKGN